MLLSALYSLLVVLRDAFWWVTKPTLVGVRAVVVRNSPPEILLVRHRSGRHPWSIPGGGVDRRERIELAGAREVHEEAGVAVSNVRLLGVYHSFRLGISNYIAVVVCTAEGEPAAPRSLEIAEARFFPVSALPAGLNPASRRRITEYLSGQHGILDMW